MSDRLARSLNLPFPPARTHRVGVEPIPLTSEYAQKLTDALQSNHTEIVDRIEELIMYDVLASRPDPTGGGRLFYATDTDVLYLDDGAWDLVGGTSLTAEYINVKEYGAKGDGTTDDITAIEDAIDAADVSEFGVVFFPPGNYLISDTITVPNKINLLGSGPYGRSVIVASGSFPTSTAVIILGESTAAFGCMIRNLSVDCSDIAGSIGVYSRRINESSGVFRCLIKNFKDAGIDIDSKLAAPVAQNYILEDITVQLSSGAGAGAIGVRINGGAGTRGMNNLTVNVTGATFIAGTTGVQIDGAAGLWSRLHFDNVATGIHIGPNAAAYGLEICGVSGPGVANMTDLVKIDSATASRAISLHAIRKNQATNVLNDQIGGYTLTTSFLGQYILGHGSPPTILSTGNGVDSILSGGLTLGSAFVQKTATFTNADATPDVSGGNVFTTANTGATTITAFDGGTDGQKITILGGDANTTFQQGAALKLKVSGDYKLEDGGTISFVRTNSIWYETARMWPTTYWDDLRVPVLSAKVPAAAGPGFSQFLDNGAASTGVFTYWFDKSTEEQIYFVAQLPHKYKHGSDLECHVHWVPASTAPGAGTDVCWGLEYSWCNINSVFSNTSIAYGDEQTNGAGETITVDKHYLTEIVTIDGDPGAVDYTFSSMLVCRLFRDAGGVGGTDDYDDDAGLLEVDFHYEIDAPGSEQEYVK